MPTLCAHSKPPPRQRMYLLAPGVPCSKRRIVPAASGDPCSRSPPSLSSRACQSELYGRERMKDTVLDEPPAHSATSRHATKQAPDCTDESGEQHLRTQLKQWTTDDVWTPRASHTTLLWRLQLHRWSLAALGRTRLLCRSVSPGYIG